MSNESFLQGQIALVTGASRGLGAEIAVDLARLGAHVCLAGRTVGGLKATDDRIQALGGTATLLPMDLLKLDEIAALGPALYHKFGRLDVFIANAAMLGQLGPIAQFDPKMWDRVIALNLTANHRLLLTLDPLLRAGKNGRAAFITDGAIESLPAYGGAYAVSKAGLRRMAALYASEAEGSGVIAGLINPGPIRTNLRAQAFPGEAPDAGQSPAEASAAVLEFLKENAPRPSRANET